MRDEREEVSRTNSVIRQLGAKPAGMLVGEYMLLRGRKHAVDDKRCSDKTNKCINYIPGIGQGTTRINDLT